LPPDFIFKSYDAPKSISAAAPPQTPVEKLTTLPQSSNLILRSPTSKKGKGKDKGRTRKRKKRIKGEEKRKEKK